MLWGSMPGKHREVHNILPSISDGSAGRNSSQTYDIKDMGSPGGICPTQSVKY